MVFEKPGGNSRNIFLGYLVCARRNARFRTRRSVRRRNRGYGNGLGLPARAYKQYC